MRFGLHGGVQVSTVCYSNTIMNERPSQTPPEETTSQPQGSTSQPQSEATKPQRDAAKRRRLARLVHRLTWQQATEVTFGIFLGPIVAAIVLVNLSGATLLDGLFGIYHNSPLQSAIVSLCMLAVPLGPLCALAFAVYFTVKRTDVAMPKRMIPAVLPASPFLLALLYTLFRP